MRPIIQSIKHYVQLPQVVLATGVNRVDVIVDGTSVAAVGAATNEVEEGSLVKNVYFEFWIMANQGTQGSCQSSIEKRPSEAPAMTFAQASTLAAYGNKKNILQTFQGLTPGNATAPLSLFKGWIKIPKGKQRIGLGDKIVLNTSPITGGGLLCGFCVYKEYK